MGGKRSESFRQALCSSSAGVAFFKVQARFFFTKYWARERDMGWTNKAYQMEGSNNHRKRGCVGGWPGVHMIVV